MGHWKLLSFVLLGCWLFSLAAVAQGGSDSSGSGGGPINVGQTSPTLLATLTFTTATTPGTLFTINVLTQGAPGLDFNFVSGGSCSTTATYAVGDTCTVLYQFSPLSPGARYGGISLTVGTTVLANTYITGLGLGPQVTFLPPTQIQLGSISFGDDIAVDGNRNVFVPDFFGALYEIPKGCTSQSCVVTMGGYNFTSVAVDGSGNVYASAYLSTDNTSTPLPLVTMFPSGCLSASCSVPLIGYLTAVRGAEGIAVDGSGDIYLSAGTSSSTEMMLVEFPTGCNSESCMVTLLDGISATSALTLDGSGNLYFADMNVVYQLPQGCRSASCLVVEGGGFNRPDGFAVDGAGNLFITDSVENAIYEVPVGCSSASCTVTVTSGSGFPFGLARDGSGNLYVNDDHNPDTIYELDLVDPPTITFLATAQGQVSATQTVTVSNGGNAPLAFAPSVLQANPSISQYFQLDSTSADTCGALISASTSPALTPGQSCAMQLAFAPVAPALGTITGTSVITDDSLNVANAMQTIPLVGVAVLPGTTSTTLSSSANPVYANVSTMLTAQVSSVSGTPTGTVTFSDGATVLATVPVSATGVSGTASASYAATFLVSGAHTLTASFTPSGIFLPSSASLLEQVNADVAFATLTASPNPALLNTPVGLSVSVSASPAGPTPTGTIRFTSNGVMLSTVTLVNGMASYTTTTLPAGGNSLSCSYSGDTNYAAANCNTVFETIDATPVALRLSLTSTANPSSAFLPVSFTALLLNGRTPVSGVQITFAVDGVGADTLTTGTNGSAVLSLANGLRPGTRTVTATSAPAGVYAGESASLAETVNLVPTSTTLTVSPSAVTYGSTMTLSATFADTLTGFAETALDGSGLLPSGTVTFYANGTALGTVPVTSAGGTVSQTVQLTTTALAVGTDTITCSYSGDMSFAASSCNSAQVTVSNPPDFSIAVTPGTQTVNPGDSAMYTIAIAGVNGPYAMPVTLAASGLPAGATVNFAQQTVVPGVGPTTTTMIIVTSPIQALLQGGSRVYLSLLWLPFLLVGGVRRRLRALPGKMLIGVWVTLMLAGVGVLGGCGGGYLGSQPVSHAIMVTATSGALSHAVPVNLTVR